MCSCTIINKLCYVCALYGCSDKAIDKHNPFDKLGEGMLVLNYDQYNPLDNNMTNVNDSYNIKTK